jgi:PASTA domain-containing protein
MDLLGAALPNIMFIVGILAVGLGLGIELKVVSLNKEIDKKGRIGAFVAGIVLIGGSLVLYLNPSLANRGQATKAEVNAAAVAPQPTQAPAAALAPAQAATAAPPPTQASPTAAAVPTQAPTPTSRPAPAPALAPTAAVLGVLVPDLHDKDDKGARDALTKAGLKPQKAEHCTGTNTVDPKPKKNRVQCQSPPAGQVVAAGTTVQYVIAGK